MRRRPTRCRGARRSIWRAGTDEQRGVAGRGGAVARRSSGRRRSMPGGSRSTPRPSAVSSARSNGPRWSCCWRSTTPRRGCAGTAARARRARRCWPTWPAGRLYFFGIEIWPQEVYYLTGLLILAAFGLFLATSLFGRALVRLRLPADGLDRPVHAGRALDRGRSRRAHALRQGALDAGEVAQAHAKHAAWLLIAFLTGGAWIMYFRDAPTVVGEFFTGEAGVGVYFFVVPVHRHDLPAGRHGARAGLHLHVPVAAHPGGPGRPGHAWP